MLILDGSCWRFSNEILSCYLLPRSYSCCECAWIQRCLSNSELRTELKQPKRPLTPKNADNIIWPGLKNSNHTAPPTWYQKCNSQNSERSELFFNELFWRENCCFLTSYFGMKIVTVLRVWAWKLLLFKELFWRNCYFLANVASMKNCGSENRIKYKLASLAKVIRKGLKSSFCC